MAFQHNKPLCFSKACSHKYNEGLVQGFVLCFFSVNLRKSMREGWMSNRKLNCYGLMSGCSFSLWLSYFVISGASGSKLTSETRWKNCHRLLLGTCALKVSLADQIDLLYCALAHGRHAGGEFAWPKMHAFFLALITLTEILGPSGRAWASQTLIIPGGVAKLKPQPPSINMGQVMSILGTSANTIFSLEKYR